MTALLARRRGGAIIRPMLDAILKEHWADTRLAFRYPEMLWLSAVLLPLAAWAIVRRHRLGLPGVSGRLRGWLTALRLAVLALIVLILAGPHLALDKQIDRKPLLALVLDQSRSMDLPVEAAKPGAQTVRRTDAAQAALLASWEKVWQPLAEKYDLQILGLRRELVPLALGTNEALKLAAPPNPGAGTTALGDAALGLVDLAAGRPIAGIVMFTDGQNTSGASPAVAGFVARRAGAPVFPVPVGSEARLKDIALVDVFAPAIVNKDDTPRINVTLQSHGFDDEQVNVVLKEGDRVVQTQPLRLSGAEQQHLDFAYKAETVGLHVLTVAVDKRPGEAVALNNQDRLVLRVTDEKLKALFVEGLPRWDYRFLRNAATRDAGLRVVEVLEAEAMRPGGDGGAALPEAAAGYDDVAVVWLGDATVKLLTPARQQALAEAVRKGGLGLVVSAGPRAMPHAYVGTPLEGLLPVVAEAAPGVPAPGYEDFKWQLAPAGRTHEVARFYDEADRNQATWGELPGFQWHAAATRLKPGAMVLAGVRSSAGGPPLPLVSLHQAGAGTVLFVGTDSTWTWRQNVGDRYFYKLWGQALRHVARRPGDQDKARLDAAPPRVAPGEEVAFTLRTPTPLANATVRIERIDAAPGAAAADNTTAALAQDPDAPPGTPRFRGPWRPPAEGRYQATFDGPGGPATAEFLVMEGIEEFHRPEVNRDAMEAFARNSGGRVVELDALSSIPPQLAVGVAAPTRLRHQQELWDQWYALALVAGLYCLDIALRRWTGLA